ncbi:transcription factor A, mitochondrial [Diabrotica virgifera virgifera]|uniref:Transcription factor A, mitochondrial n=1 Tax=Diabrotica virgifera virgifera TaxID=50390 RepID=A0A6P7FHE8_DIAVI|nr:transcription factor A, mitochondrial [Diabrotica virgifera virgifera]
MAGQGFLFKTFNVFNSRIISANRLNVANFQTPTRTIKTETKERLKSLNIPEKPKKPLTPYLQYVNQKRSTIVKENPNILPKDVLRKLSEEWKQVTEEEKEKLKEKYQKEAEIYDKDILKFNTALTAEQREILQIANNEKKEDRKKRKITKLLKETHKPKKPQGPYLLYLQEQSKIRNVPLNILIKTVKNDWAQVSDSQKEKYRAQYAKEHEKYEIELENWEKKMISEGHPELVRVKHRVPEERPSRILDLKGKKPSKQ